MGCCDHSWKNGLDICEPETLSPFSRYEFSSLTIFDESPQVFEGDIFSFCRDKKRHLSLDAKSFFEETVPSFIKKFVANFAYGQPFILKALRDCPEVFEWANAEYLLFLGQTLKRVMKLKELCNILKKLQIRKS